MLLIFFAALLAASVWFFVKSNRLKHQLNRYEFSNRTDGGVVKFESYEHSIAHRKKREKENNLYANGIMLAFVGVIGFVATVIFS